MNDMIKKVNDFCEQSDELIVEAMKMAFGMEEVTLEDIMSGVVNITPEQFQMFQKLMKYYMLTKEIVKDQTRMLVDMNDKLDKVLEKLEK